MKGLTVEEIIEYNALTNPLNTFTANGEILNINI